MSHVLSLQLTDQVAVCRPLCPFPKLESVRPRAGGRHPEATIENPTGRKGGGERNGEWVRVDFWEPQGTGLATRPTGVGKSAARGDISRVSGLGGQVFRDDRSDYHEIPKCSETDESGLDEDLRWDFLG